VLDGQRDEGKEKQMQGQMDVWTNGDVQADREVDIINLTSIFLNIANGSKAEKEFWLRVYFTKL
jgi:hypothetical protein